MLQLQQLSADVCFKQEVLLRRTGKKTCRRLPCQVTCKAQHSDEECKRRTVLGSQLLLAAAAVTVAAPEAWALG